MKHEADKPLLKVVDILYVNLLWLLFSLPVITIGPAICASNYVMIKIVGNKEVSCFKMFLKGFKDNFKQGILMTFVTVLLCSLTGGIWYLLIANDMLNIITIGLGVIFSISFINLNIFMYALIARYENTFLNMVRNAIVRVLQFYARGFLIFILVIIEVGIVAFMFYLSLVGGIISLFFWPGLIMYTVCLLMKEVYRQIEENM